MKNFFFLIKREPDLKIENFFYLIARWLTSVLFFTPRKRSLFDQLTKIYLNTGNSKNASVYQHPDIETPFSTKKKLYNTTNKAFCYNMMDEMVELSE